MNEKKQTQPQQTKDEAFKERLRQTFGTDINESLRQTGRLPGTGSILTPTGYTSEAELRAKVDEIIKRPAKRLTKEQMAIIGIDLDPGLKTSYESSQKKTLSIEEKTELGAKWLERLVQAAKTRGRLMTDQQLADWQVGRKLVRGDRAKYVGPSRIEQTSNDFLVPREPGQIGTIVAVEETKEARFLVFHPDVAVAPIEAPGIERQLVDLQVREFTSGWLCLERLPA